VDTSKLRTGEIVAPASAIALFVFLFIDWIGAEGSDEGLSGWDYLGGDVTGFIVFLAVITALMLGGMAAAGRRTPMGGWPWGGPTTALGILSFDIILWRLFTVPDGGELNVGIFLGLLAAAGIAAGGYLTLRDGGLDLLAGRSGAPTRPVASSGATTTRSSASTTPRPATKKRAAKKRAAKKRAAAKRRAGR
jgi:hypothetical protein